MADKNITEMPRDVLTIEEDDGDHMEESNHIDSEDNDEPENTLPQIEAGATVSFMHHPVRKRATQQKVIRKKKLTKKEERSKRKLHADKLMMALVKPDASTDREKERYLRKIATKGVVQLFNAVAERQRTMSKALQQKMTAKQRKETKEKFTGNNFNVYQEGKIEIKEEEDIKQEKEDEESSEASGGEDVLS